MPSGPEWIIVLVLVLVIFGGSQLPKLAKNLGRAQREFKDGISESEREAAAKAASANTTNLANPANPSNPISGGTVPATGAPVDPTTPPDR